MLWPCVSEEFNKLFWITETEVNTDYFIIERSLNDALHFEEIGQVEAAGFVALAQTVTPHNDNGAASTINDLNRIRMIFSQK